MSSYRKDYFRLGSQSGSVLAYVLLMVLLTASALVIFMERAHREIRTEAMYYQRDQVRAEAYSALEIVLAVLEDVVEIDGALRDPAQGWGDPFAYAEWEGSGDATVDFTFRDHTGRLSLVTIEPDVFERLLEFLEFDLGRREDLTDAFFQWTREDFTPRGVGMDPERYAQREIAHGVPSAPLRSYAELWAIEGFAEAFRDETGVPGERFQRFRELTTLAPTGEVNVNSLRPEILQILLDDMDGQQVLSGEDIETLRPTEQPWFTSPGEAGDLWGISLGGGNFGTEIQALEVEIAVRRGDQTTRLTVLLSRQAPPSGPGQGLDAGGEGDPRRVGAFYLLSLEER
ncbi:MAG: general secretion pathway protein GspK [Opitutales bacterium]|nr:general secretion pathway protein GspK [Opitutales bacterium]